MAGTGLMIAKEVIEQTTTEWAAVIVFDHTNEDSLHFCVDYQKLNSVSIRDASLLPRKDECIGSFGDTTVFSTLDDNSGYWKIEIDKRDRDKTAFTSHRSLFKFTSMPFGLKNDPRAVSESYVCAIWLCAIAVCADLS